nr:hypothetical protein [uncultured Celeribacter sp.]
MTMNFKALAAAALVAVAGSAAVAGPNYIMPGAAQSLGADAKLDLVRTDAPSTVSIYNFHNGERGELLGSTVVNAGANTDVYVPLNRPGGQDALAVISQGGSDVASVKLNQPR